MKKTLLLLAAITVSCTTDPICESIVNHYIYNQQTNTLEHVISYRGKAKPVNYTENGVSHVFYLTEDCR